MILGYWNMSIHVDYLMKSTSILQESPVHFYMYLVCKNCLHQKSYSYIYIEESAKCQEILNSERDTRLVTRKINCGFLVFV